MSRCGRRRCGAVLVACSLLAGLALAVGAPTAGAEEPEAIVSSDVANTVATNGETDVIVALRTAIPVTSGADAAAERARRLSMGRAAEAFVEQLPGAIERPSGLPRPSRFVNLRLDAAGVDALRTSPWVASIMPNEQRKLSLAKGAPTIGAPIAWESGYTGGGSAIAIIDSGVQTGHPFLGGRVVGEACFSGGSTDQAVSSLCPGGVDFDEGPGTGGPCSMPDCIHGTHVAGIAAGANGPNSAPSGVAPEANVVSVMAASRLTSTHLCGGPSTCLTLLDFDILSALDWVGANQSSYDIVAANMSFGGGSFGGDCDVFVNNGDPLYWYTLFFQAYREVGIAPVVASGNGGESQAMTAPACVSSALAVGAIATSNLQVPFWSNSSPTLDFLAPGTDVDLPASPGTPFGIMSSVPPNQYSRIPGTSMAAPHVAGAIAVLQDANPGLSVDWAELVLKLTGRDITDGRQGRSTPLIQLDEAIPKPKGTYHPVDPARLLDTRNGTGAPQAKVGAGKSIELQVGGRGGVPSNGVSAVLLNVTYVLPSSVGFVTVWPTGALRPNASNLNLNPGDARPNLVTVRMGANGKVSLYNAVGNVDLVADVAGWYDEEPSNNGSYFHAVSPVRVLDTRDGTGAPQGKVGPGGKLTIDMDDLADTPVPVGATAVVVNLTGTGATAGTHVTAYPADLPNPPVASNLNLSTGQTRPNLAIVPLDSDGELTLYNNAGSTDLIVDVEGWYDSTPGYRFVPMTPTRILDSRFGNGRSGPLGSNSTFDLQVTGRENIPDDVAGVVMNVTSTRVSTGGFVTVYPNNMGTPPLASSLNLEIGRDVPNLVSTNLPGSGMARFYNKVGNVDLIGDVAGWFEP